MPYRGKRNHISVDVSFLCSCRGWASCTVWAYIPRGSICHTQLGKKEPYFGWRLFSLFMSRMRLCTVYACIPGGSIFHHSSGERNNVLVGVYFLCSCRGWATCTAWVCTAVYATIVRGKGTIFWLTFLVVVHVASAPSRVAYPCLSTSSGQWNHISVDVSCLCSLRLRLHEYHTVSRIWFGSDVYFLLVLRDCACTSILLWIDYWRFFSFPNPMRCILIGCLQYYTPMHSYERVQ